MLQICINIKQERDLQKISQEKMAERLNIERSTYKNWESGTEPSITNIKAIAEALNIPAWRLLIGVIDFNEERARPDVKIEGMITAEQADSLRVSLNVLDSIFSLAALKGQSNRESVSLGNKTFRQSGEKKGKQKDIS